MDAFAVTGVSRGLKWFRVEGVVGGVDTPARRYPRMHVMQAGAIAALAAAGRRVYFVQAEPDAPLVPLSPGHAARFDARMVPSEELPRFAFLEHATDDDIDALLSVRMGQNLAMLGLRLKRLEALDWAGRAPGEPFTVTRLGVELLRHWLGAAPALPPPSATVARVHAHAA